jgi:hypothetical protein
MMIVGCKCVRLFGQFFYFTVGILFTINVYGQDVCSRNLEAAGRQFEGGHFYNVEPLLTECLKNGFSRQERINALKLLALTKLYLDELDQADSVYLVLLRMDPERRVNETVDPPDLIFLHNHFRSKPVFYWSIIGGINFSVPTIIHDYSIFVVEETDEQQKARLGFEGGVNIEFNVYQNLFAGGELLFIRKNFLYTDDVKFYSKERSAGYKISQIESNNYFSVPVFLKYMIGEERIRPYIYGGMSFDFLMFSTHRDIGRESPLEEDAVEITSRDITTNRNAVNLSGILGIGAMVKTGGLSLIAMDLRIMPGLTNITKESGRYSDQAGLVNSGAVSDAMRINSISLSVRFITPFYNPKLKKK